MSEREHRLTREQRDLESMRADGDLTPAAADDLARRMATGEDAYPYRSVVGRPFIWAESTRFVPWQYSLWVAAGCPTPADWWLLQLERRAQA